MLLNPLFLIDSYKISHKFMYPDGISEVYSNFTARSGTHSNLNDKNFGHTVFVGLQGTLKQLTEIWDEGFFKLPKDEVVTAYKRRIEGIVGPGQDVDHIAALHDLGYLPIEVRALKEGTLVPYKVPYFTIRNTHPYFYWLTNFLEDFLSASSWKAINNATLAYELRTILTEYSKNQGLSLDLVPWQGHDFSFRGMSGIYDGSTTAFAHLTSFSGSDSVAGIDYVEQYYNADISKQLISGSVPASEHSVICAGGEDGEIETFRRMLKIYPTGLLSMVSDSWDFFRVITEYAEILKPEIMARPGKLVYRPDSGDPADILCGIKVRTISGKTENFEEWKEWVAENMDIQFRANLDAECPHDSETEFYRHEETVYKVTYEPDLNRHDKQYYYVDNYGSKVSKCIFEEIKLTPEQKGAVQCLWEVFGGTTNEKGFRTLDSHVGLIYGDSITAERMNDILARLEEKGFAANNVVFGIGSYSYNMSSRDTHGQAMKATYVVVNGEGRNIQKNPKTGDGMKKSATGLLRVVEENGQLKLLDSQDTVENSLLEPVYRDGKLLRETSLSEIRERLWGWNDKF